MSVDLVCSCGVHLRAKDNMAARRAICPRCGAAIGVPLPQLKYVVTPLTPDAEPPFVLPVVAPSGSPILTIPKPMSAGWRRPMEKSWYECLAYPFFNCGSLLTLAFVLTVLSGTLVLLVSGLSDFDETPLMQWFSYLPWLLALLLFLALAGAIVECALKSALAGKGLGTYWPTPTVATVKSCLRWLICFLAGPSVLLTMAAYFWLYGGDWTNLDYAIAAELIVSAIAYWFLTVICSAERDRLRDANPARVAELLRRLGRRAVVPLLIAPAVIYAHAAIGVLALSALHEHFSAWMLLMICWGSGLFALAALFRLFGVWCYRNPIASAD